MRLKKSFQLAFNILLHSRLRSWLTIIGIVIGIGAVVSIISISQGAQQQLEERLGALGADILTITPGNVVARTSGVSFTGGGGMGSGRQTTTTTTIEQKNLTQRDVLAISSLNNINFVVGEVSGRGDITYLTKTATLSIKGVNTIFWRDITTEKLVSGRYLSSGDTNAVVLGGRVVGDTFSEGITLNSKISINGRTFTVVGILETGSNVYIPFATARSLLDDVGQDEFNSILVKIEDVSLAEETVQDITKRLMLSRGILDSRNQDFTVTNPIQMQETMRETMNTMAIFLGAIAAISLLVGGIGIANTMFTSVLEKTKEIGIMKSIGAKNKDILLIFLFNAGLIGLVGGIGGIALGVFGSAYVGSFISNGAGGIMRGMGNTIITPSLVFGALAFSVVVGIFAGIVPAYRASKLNPVDALRHE